MEGKDCYSMSLITHNLSLQRCIRSIYFSFLFCASFFLIKVLSLTFNSWMCQWRRPQPGSWISSQHHLLKQIMIWLMQGKLYTEEGFFPEVTSAGDKECNKNTCSDVPWQADHLWHIWSSSTDSYMITSALAFCSLLQLNLHTCQSKPQSTCDGK